MKKGLIGFILGALLFGSIGVYAATRYMSKDISYIKEDGTTINVESALNELYKNSNELIVGEYHAARSNSSEERLGLGLSLYNDQNYLTYDSSNYKVTVVKTGNYTIKYRMVDLANKTYQSSFKLQINDNVVSSIVNTSKLAGKIDNEITLNLNENDIIDSLAKGGGGSSQTQFTTTIIYNGDVTTE